MSSEEHCRHCDERLCVVLYAGLTEHANISGARWLSRCPACAEAERIAAWCDAQAERVRSERSYYYDDRDVRANRYDYAAEFARGET